MLNQLKQCLKSIRDAFIQVDQIESDDVQQNFDMILDNVISTNTLLLQCVTRIAEGNSSDPRKDAYQTLIGSSVFAAESLEIARRSGF